VSAKTNVTLKAGADLVRADRKAYHAAKRRALTRLRRAHDLGWKRPASRDKLHER